MKKNLEKKSQNVDKGAFHQNLTAYEIVCNEADILHDISVK